MTKPPFFVFLNFKLCRRGYMYITTAAVRYRDVFLPFTTPRTKIFMIRTTYTCTMYIPNTRRCSAMKYDAKTD